MPGSFSVPEDWCHSYTGLVAWIRTACGCHSPFTSSSFSLPHVESVHRMTTAVPLLMYNGSQDYHLEAPQSTYLVQPIVTLGGHCLVLLLLGTLSPAGSEPWFPAWQSSTLCIRPHTPTLLFLRGLSPMVFLSIGLFSVPTTWSYEQNLDCAHLYNVISWTEMLLYSYIVGVLNYFLFCCFCPLWFLSFRAFVLWCFCPFGLLSVRLHDHMNRMLIGLTCISWSHEQKWDCTPWLLEY